MSKARLKFEKLKSFEEVSLLESQLESLDHEFMTNIDESGTHTVIWAQNDCSNNDELISSTQQILPLTMAN